MKTFRNLINLLLLTAVLAVSDYLINFDGIGKWLIPQILIDLPLAMILLHIANHSKEGKTFIRVVGILYIVYCLVQSFYVQIFEVPLRFQQISIIKELFSVKDSINLTSRPERLIYILLIIVLYQIKPTEKKKTWNSRALTFLLLLLNIGTFAIFENSTNMYVLKLFGAEHMIVNDVVTTFGAIKNKMTVNDDELKKFNQAYAGQEDNDVTGLLEGKNVIMILCESLDDYAISEELTPTIYWLKENSWHFSRYHSPLYEYHTCDTEFMTLTGQIPSLEFGVTNYMYSNHNYPSALPYLFKQNGYQAKSYHSYLAAYYNRLVMHERFGFDKLYDAQTIQPDKSEYSFTSISDEELFDSIDFSDTPFFKFVITLSGHGPYDNDNRTDIQNEKQIVENSSFLDKQFEVKNYLSAQMKLDKGLEKLIEKLKEAGVYDNTAIILYGDHVPYTLATQEAKDEIIKDDIVPFLVFAPGIGSRKIEKDMSLLQ